VRNAAEIITSSGPTFNVIQEPGALADAETTTTTETTTATTMETSTTDSVQINTRLNSLDISCDEDSSVSLLS